jgi:hypothetical protein
VERLSKRCVLPEILRNVTRYKLVAMVKISAQFTSLMEAIFTAIANVIKQQKICTILTVFVVSGIKKDVGGI